MHESLCICPEIPSIESRVRLVFAVHPAEKWKTTSTGRLAALGVNGSAVSHYAGRVGPFDPPLSLGGDGATAVLFPPREDEAPAVLATTWVEGVERTGQRPVIVVPDGTWTQCRKIVGRHPRLRDLPRLALPEDAAPRGGLRIENLSHGMSTIDAVAWLLEAIDGPAAAAPLVALHRAMLERTMASRGTPLPDGRSLNELLAEREV